MSDDVLKDFLDDAKGRMQRSVDATKTEFATVRTGRASRTCSTGSRLTTTARSRRSGSSPRSRRARRVCSRSPPYDKNSIKAIEKAILESDVGLTPSNDGQVIRLSIPELTEERRKELVKVVHGIAEQGRVAVRNVRRDVMHDLRELKSEGEVGEDDERRAESELQKLTDSHVGDIDTALAGKEQEILEVSSNAAARARYVAIITDGNGRWARDRGLPVLAGHQAGADVVKARLRDAVELGVSELTVYSFSTENWTRPKAEVDGLMAMFAERIDRETPELHEEGVRMRFVGPPRGAERGARPAHGLGGGAHRGEVNRPASLFDRRAGCRPVGRGRRRGRVDRRCREWFRARDTRRHTCGGATARRCPGRCRTAGATRRARAWPRLRRVFRWPRRGADGDAGGLRRRWAWGWRAGLS